MINQYRDRHLFSLAVIRLVGYGLFLMAVIDFIMLIIPPQLMNPAWELQTTGALVERIPITLLGMALIYYGERNERTPREQFILKWLSWLSLILAIFFFLSIPLNISNTVKIYHSYNARVHLQTSQKIDSIDKFRQQIKSANSADLLQTILQQQTPQRINIPASVDRDRLKSNLLDSLVKKEETLRSQAKKSSSQRAYEIIKKSLKWNLGSLISACIFLFIWKNTLWARIDYNSD